MEFQIGSTAVELLRSDITTLRVEGIVNAANSSLAGGGGVDGAIHRAGGPRILEECRKIGGCPTGSAVATSAGDLPARRVIHAVGPIWKGGDQNESALLVSAYRRSLEIADAHGLKSLGFPSISTGAYGYPILQASRIALTTVRDYLLTGSSKIERIVFALFSNHDLKVYDDAAREILGPGDERP